MKKVVLVIALVILAAILLVSQEHKGKGRINGFVLDEQGAPLEGVKIKFVYAKSQTGVEAVSEKDGAWVVAWLRGGEWYVDFEKFGYEPRKITLQVQEWQRNPEVRINLKKATGLILTEELKKLLNQGNALFDAKDYAGALAVYSDILAKYPDAYIINKNIGNCHFAQEKYDLAEQSFQKILEKDPQNAEAMILIGNTYINRGDNATALEWYGKIDIAKIEDAVVLYNIGTNYYNNGKFEDALRYYQKSVEIQKEFPDGLYQLGLTYLNLQKNAEAIAAFEAYLKADPDSPRAAQVQSFLEYLRKK
jgi:tetratricopeptide (TPR) repeat protein